MSASFFDLDHKSQSKYLIKHSKILLNCIFTYRKKEQELCDIVINTPIKIYDVLKPIFDTLEKNDIKELIKISTCMSSPKKTDLPKCLEECNGKFYFNLEVNDDEDARECVNFRNKYLSGNIESCELCLEKNTIVFPCDICKKKICDGCVKPSEKEEFKCDKC